MEVVLRLAAVCALLVTGSAHADPPSNSCADLYQAPAAALREAVSSPALASKATRTLRADPGNFKAHFEVLALLAQRAPKSALAAESAAWLAYMCPSLPLLSHPKVARVGSSQMTEAWERMRRRSSSAAVHGNYWSYISEHQPLDLRPRPTDPRWSASERKKRITSWRSGAAPGKPHVVGLAAFEAYRAELRGLAGKTLKANVAAAYLEAARAARDAGFHDAAVRFAGEYLAQWNRNQRPEGWNQKAALALMGTIAETQGDSRLAKSLAAMTESNR